MYCKNCGTYNPDGAKFCKNCGFELEEVIKKEEPAVKPTVEHSHGNSQQQTSAPKNSSDDMGTWIGCCLCLIAIFIIFAIFGSF